MPVCADQPADENPEFSSRDAADTGEGYDRLIVNGWDPMLSLEEECTVSFELRHYSSPLAEEYEVYENVSYSYTIRGNCVTVDETEASDTFIIRRVSPVSGEIEVDAYLDGIAVAKESLSVQRLNYAIDIKCDQSDDFTLRYDQDVVLTYTTVNLDEIPYTISFSGMVTGEYAGRYLEEGTDYEVRGDQIILHGAKICEYDGTDVTISVFVEYNGQEICQDDIQGNLFKQKPIENAWVRVEKAIYTGSELTPAVTVRYNGNTLNEGTDYTLKYSDNINVETGSIGRGKVTITGIGDYKGSITESFVIFCKTPEKPTLSNTTNGIKITWKRPPQAVRVEIMKKTGNGEWEILAQSTSLSYIDKSVRSGTKYSYTIACISADGTMRTSENDPAGRSIVYVAPPKIKGIANYNAGVKVTWDKVAGAAKYRVFRKTGSGSWSKLADTSSAAYTDTSAGNGIKYIYTVRCLNGAGKYVSAYDTAGKEIVFVARPTISSLTSPKTRTMLVKWGRNTSATGYKIQYSQSSTFASGNKLVSVSGAENYYKTITGLTSKKVYYARVRAYKTVGGKNYYSAWSAAKQIKIR